MPLLEATGAPKIITPVGEEIELPYPTSSSFMQGAYGDESEVTNDIDSYKSVVGNRRLRVKFNFGYRYIDADTAAKIVRVFEQFDSFDFIPRRVSGSDPATAVERQFRVRFTSDMPFIVHPDGHMVFDQISLESTEEDPGTGIIVPGGTFYFITQDENAGGSGYAAGEVIEANSLYRRSTDGSIAKLVDFGAATPTAIELSQTRGLIIVGLSGGAINTYDLLGNYIDTLVNIGQDVDTLAIVDSGEFEGSVFYLTGNSSSRTLHRVSISGGTALPLHTGSGNHPVLSIDETDSRIFLSGSAPGDAVFSLDYNGANKLLHFNNIATNTRSLVMVRPESNNTRLYFWEGVTGGSWYSIPYPGTHVNGDEVLHGGANISDGWYDKENDRIVGGNGLALVYHAPNDGGTIIEMPILYQNNLLTRSDFGAYEVNGSRVWQSLSE